MQFAKPGGGFRIVAIHVKNWRLHHARNISRVRRGARFFWRGCETDLIIHDQVHCAAGRISIELRKVQRFRHDALPRECRIAVQ